MSQLSKAVAGTELSAFSEFESHLAKFKEKYEDKVYDLTDLVQNKECRSDIREIGSMVARLDKRHAELKAPLKEQSDKLDGVRKTIKDEFRTVQQGMKDHIVRHEAKITEREERLQGLVASLAIDEWFEGSAYVDRSAAEISSKIESILGVEVDETYEEREADASIVKSVTLERLAAMLAIAEKREADEADLDRLQKESREREEQERLESIRQEESDKAKLEADAAAQKKIDDAEEATRRAVQETKEADARAEQSIADAKQTARDAARRHEEEKTAERNLAKKREERAATEERERIEREQAEVAKIESDRLAAEEKKKAKASHRKKIEKEAIAGLVNAGFSQDDAFGIVKRISQGAIPHISINY